MTTRRDKFTAEPSDSRIYEVREFIRFRPDGELVPVQHYRTVLHGDGRISRESFPVQPLLENAIRAFRGAPEADSGTLRAVFPEPRDAEECARAIARHHGRNADVSGAFVTVAV